MAIESQDAGPRPVAIGAYQLCMFAFLSVRLRSLHPICMCYVYQLCEHYLWAYTACEIKDKDVVFSLRYGPLKWFAAHA
jgi:hypothetical protein